MNRPVVLVDVDGVCGFFTRHVADSVRGEAALEPEDVVQWDLFALLPPDVSKSMKKRLQEPDWWGSMPVFPGAQDAIAKLREVAEIVFASSPWYSCVGWESARREWLKRHFDAKPDDIIFGHRKDLLVGAALIDDKPETVDAWAQRQGGQAILFDAPYNRMASGRFLRLHGWDQVLAHVSYRCGALQ